MPSGPRNSRECERVQAIVTGGWKRLASGAAVALAVMLGGDRAAAQSYPARPITVIIPFAGGSASDVVTRILLDRVSRSLGKPIVIENRPGSGGNIGTQAATKAPPDGYTLVASGGGALGANKALTKEFNYDPHKELDPISLLVTFPNLVVTSKKLPVTTLAEFIAYAKAHPGEVNYGSVGVGTSQHLAGTYFEQLTGIKLTHVPYRNIAQFVPDLLAGQVPAGFSWYPNVSAALQADGARVLAVPGKRRLAILPDVPTTAEAGLPGYVASGWFALLAPRGTPKDIIARLNQEVIAAGNDPAVRERFREQGAEVTTTSPEELRVLLLAEQDKWIDIIKKAGIEPQ
jgi:tripartite-type tricarboxylate transporter receptor subunit TctC